LFFPPVSPQVVLLIDFFFPSVPRVTLSTRRFCLLTKPAFQYPPNPTKNPFPPGCVRLAPLPPCLGMFTSFFFVNPFFIPTIVSRRGAPRKAAILVFHVSVILIFGPHSNVTPLFTVFIFFLQSLVFPTVKKLFRQVSFFHFSFSGALSPC